MSRNTSNFHRACDPTGVQFIGKFSTWNAALVRKYPRRIAGSSARMFASGLGCVKTPKSDLRIEISSRLRQFEKQNAGDNCREKTIEKTILRLHRARTFSHSLGHKLPRSLKPTVSVLPPKAAAAVTDRRVRYGHNRTHALQHNLRSANRKTASAVALKSDWVSLQAAARTALSFFVPR